MLLDKLKGDDNFGDMGLMGYCSLYQDLKECKAGEQFNLQFLESQTRTLVKKHFGEYVWSSHQNMASVIPEPSVFFYDEHVDEVNDSLDELIDILPEGDVWALPWEWYDGGKYAKEFAISENWWRAYKSIEKLLFLKNFNRL